MSLENYSPGGYRRGYLRFFVGCGIDVLFYSIYVFTLPAIIINVSVVLCHYAIRIVIRASDPKKADNF
jgi:hypothetical protein